MRHPLLDAVPRRLGVPPALVVYDADGTAVGTGGTGCRLSIAGGLLHVEVRCALQVSDAEAVESYCEARNHLALLGRWVYDAQHGVVALVADLALPEQPAYDLEAVAAETVAELVDAVSWQQYLSAPQRRLRGLPALAVLAVLDGRPLTSQCGLDQHLVTHTHPAGTDPDEARAALTAVQQLDGWHGEPDRLGDDLADGTRLRLLLAKHPGAGWGVVVAAVPPDELSLGERSARNAAGALPERHALGRWTYSVDHAEHRTFLTAAVLRAAGDTDAQAQFIADVASDLLEQSQAAPTGRALLWPCWPGDDLAEAQARRQPWNEHRAEDDPEWYGIYLDRFGRMGTMSEPGFHAWLATLSDEDLDDEATAKFNAFMHARVADRDEALATGPAVERLPANLLYGKSPQHDSLALLDNEQALAEVAEIELVQRCLTIGELRAVAAGLKHVWCPVDLEEHAELTDDQPFAWSEADAVQAGDWPLMPDQGILDWIPDEVFAALVDRCGAEERDTVLNGPYLRIPPESEDELVQVLTEHAASVRRDDDLVRRLAGR